MYMCNGCKNTCRKRAGEWMELRLLSPHYTEGERKGCVGRRGGPGQWSMGGGPERAGIPPRFSHASTRVGYAFGESLLRYTNTHTKITLIQDAG